MAELIVEDCQFWFVWTKTGRIPRFTHNLEADAIAEADRLAAKHPGKKFIVLRGYRKVHAMPASVANTSAMDIHATPLQTEDSNV